ncbi:RNA polymerase subunit sigma [Streptomyces sp. TP-A0874]|uniref:RNA polymerase subunit sigma n=1 Tax=Streptomyces sp. TP-A0874 TaxID=549819 RepID=UPI000853C273|nr:RNA polymerase subunit sigma [Streptomyces sp. TP-A0874]
MTLSDLLTSLRPLLAAEAAAEALGTGMDPADIEQGVLLRLLERSGGPDAETGSGTVQPPPGQAADWLRAAVRAEVRGARRRSRREVSYGQGDPPGRPAVPVEDRVLAGEERGAVRRAVRRLPGRCPRLLGAMLSPADPTYREIAGELGISQGSLGPVRSRCLSCLRRMLAAEVAASRDGGRER